MTRPADYDDRLRDAAQSLGLSLSAEQHQKIISYLSQLQRWNKTYNLTAIRDADQMLVQHIFDSLAVLPYLDEKLYKHTVSDTGTIRVVDVGSGAGLPGIVLAIMRPWELHCIDAVEKKTAFMRQMSGTLGLSNLHVHHGRVEALPSLQAQLVVCRAFSSLLDFARLAGHHARPKAGLLALKGQVPESEIQELGHQDEWQLDEVSLLTVPELAARRCLVHLSRRQSDAKHIC